MAVLTKKMERYVKIFPEREGYTEETASKYDRRLANYAITGLNQLTLLIKKLPEELQAQIFSAEVMKPFFG